MDVNETRSNNKSAGVQLHRAAEWSFGNNGDPPPRYADVPNAVQPSLWVDDPTVIDHQGVGFDSGCRIRVRRVYRQDDSQQKPRKT